MSKVGKVVSLQRTDTLQLFTEAAEVHEQRCCLLFQYRAHSNTSNK